MVLLIQILSGTRHNGIRSTKRRSSLKMGNICQPKYPRPSDNGCKESPDQSITGFKIVFDHQNLGMEPHM